MTIERRTSGKYRIKQMVDGTLYSVTVDHKPSRKEAQILITKQIEAGAERKAHSTSFEKAYRDYVNRKNNILSPSTLKGYETMFNNLPEEFKQKSIYDIDAKIVQALINDYAGGNSAKKGCEDKPRSAKSVYNLNGFIVSIMKTVRPELIIKTTLPQKEKKVVYVPSSEDVKAILEEAKGTKYEIPLILATYGLRRGEIVALTIEDLTDQNELIICKDKVQNAQNEWIVKNIPKTEESNRKIYLDQVTADLIREKGCIYDGHPELIYRYLTNAQKKLSIPAFPLHMMRHYFASATHEMGLSDADIMAMGGWKTDHIMKTVYRSAMEKNLSEGKIRFADKMASMVRAQ